MTWFHNALRGNRRHRLATVPAFLFLLGARSAAAQPIQIILPIESLDRRVVLRWTPAAGDTFTAADRLDVATSAFSADPTQGFARNQFRPGALITGQGPSRLEATGSVLDIGAFEDLYLDAQPPAPVPPNPVFEVSGVFQFGRNRVGVAYSQDVDPISALNANSYGFTPPLSFNGLSLQENGQTVIIETSTDLAPGTTYSLIVAGVTNDQGVPLSATGPFDFDAPAVTGAVNIDQLYANPQSYLGQSVTVFGQVTLATGARTEITPDGFIQDGSGRGVRLLGGAVQPAVDSRGNAVVVTGTLQSDRGLRLTGYTATLLASGLPFLGPRVVSLAQVSNPANEGSLLRTSGYFSRVDAESNPDLIRYFAVTRDTLFAGYQVWRASEQDPTNFALLRTYSLLDSTWTFVGNERIMVDPDSIIARGTEHDEDREDDELVPGPFNGFGYQYSVTWFDGVVDATVNPVQMAVFDTLRGEEGVLTPIVYPTPEARVSTPLLGQIRVVPNPYNPGAAFGQQEFPGTPRVQFVNLPSEALVKIYTASGDLVRELEKPADPGNDSVVWDLKNADGRDVSSGVYVYYVKSGSEEARGHFVIAR